MSNSRNDLNASSNHPATDEIGGCADAQIRGELPDLLPHAILGFPVWEVHQDDRQVAEQIDDRRGKLASIHGAVVENGFDTIYPDNELFQVDALKRERSERSTDGCQVPADYRLRFGVEGPTRSSRVADISERLEYRKRCIGNHADSLDAASTSPTSVERDGSVQPFPPIRIHVPVLPLSAALTRVHEVDLPEQIEQTPQDLVFVTTFGRVAQSLSWGAGGTTAKGGEEVVKLMCGIRHGHSFPRRPTDLVTVAGQES